MDNKYKFQSACQISKVETMSDNTLRIRVDMQELTVDREVALMALRKLPVNILVSPMEINQEDLQSVDVVSEEDKEHFGKKAKTKSQRLRNILWRVWESEGCKGTDKNFYAQEMDRICAHYIDKYLQD